MSQQYYLCFDVGGTNIEAAILNERGQTLVFQNCLTKNYLSKKKIAGNFLNLARELLARGKFKPRAIIIGWPSLANLKLGAAEIRQYLKRYFSCPIIIDNDANLFALGEASRGWGRQKKIVVGLTIGTGIGCGLVINKKIFYGQGGASEIGHATINFNGPRCSCGNRGCFEEYVGRKGLKLLAKKYKLKNYDGENLFQMAKQGSKYARRLWQDFGEYLGIGLVTVINAYHPDVIILGGKISLAWPFFQKKMKNIIKQRSLLGFCPIKVSRLANAALAGAQVMGKNIRRP